MVLDTVKAITLEETSPGTMTGPITIRMLIPTADVTPGLEDSVAMFKFLEGGWHAAVEPYGTGGTIFLGESDHPLFIVHPAGRNRLKVKILYTPGRVRWWLEAKEGFVLIP